MHIFIGSDGLSYFTESVIHREGHGSLSTQTQALNGLVLLYHQVLHKKLGHLGKIERPTRLKRLPTVLSHEEALRVLQRLEGMYRINGGVMRRQQMNGRSHVPFLPGQCEGRYDPVCNQ